MEHWKLHKTSCQLHESVTQQRRLHSRNSQSNNSIETSKNENTEIRQCRCMFCGTLVLAVSQEDTEAHLSVCPALQEQLNDPSQFTLPQSMR